MKKIILLFFIFCCHRSFAQTGVIDSLQKIINEGKTDDETAKALSAVSAEFGRTDIAKSKLYANRFINICKQLKNDDRLSAAYSQMMTLEMNIGQKDSAVYYLDLLKTLAAPQASDIVKSNYYFSAGLFYKKENNFKAALPFMIRALDILERESKSTPSVPMRTSLAGQYLNTGNTYTQTGDYQNALAYHIQALKLFEALDNKRGISFCYQSVSTDFIQLAQFDEALLYLKKSQDIKTALNDKRGLATNSGQYAVIYRGLQQYDKSITYFEEAAASYHDMKMLPDEAGMNEQLAKVYVLKKDIPAATHYFDLAKALAFQTKDSTLLIDIAAETGAMKNSNEQQKKTEQKLMSSLRNSVETEDKSREISSYRYLADYYTTNKQYDKALEYTNMLHRVNDSIQNKDLQLQLKKMEEQYNSEKKDKEILLLKKDQQLSSVNLQKQKSFQLDALVCIAMLLVMTFLIINRYRIVQRSKRLIDIEKMRNDIARDLHDDIGSTITSINILSKVGLSQAGNTPEINGSFEKIKTRSSAIMESMSDIVWAINPANDSLQKTIIKMKEFAAEVLEAKGITPVFNETGEGRQKLTIEQRKDLYLIFKEAINNAVKYSGATEVHIDLQNERNRFLLSIRDNGAGFDSAKEYSGNGLKNMSARAKDMGAVLDIRSQPGAGTTVSLVLQVT